MIQKLVDNMEFDIIPIDPDCPAAGHMLRGRVVLESRRGFDIMESEKCEFYEEHSKEQLISCIHAYLYDDLKADLLDLRRQLRNLLDGSGSYEMYDEIRKACDTIGGLQEKIEGI